MGGIYASKTFVELIVSVAFSSVDSSFRVNLAVKFPVLQFFLSDLHQVGIWKK
jgi:hypothetical protein